jgi:hypothetical protein
MDETLETAIKQYKQFTNNCKKSLPQDLTKEEKKLIIEELSEQLGLGLNHLKVIYKKGYALGKNISGLIKYSQIQEYKSHLEGLGRHLQDGFQIISSSQEIIKYDQDARKLRLFQTLTNHKYRRFS